MSALIHWSETLSPQHAWELLAFVAAFLLGSLVFGSCGCSPRYTSCGNVRAERHCSGAP